MPYSSEQNTYKPVAPSKAWKTTGKGPHATVMGIAVDLAGNVPIIHRGPEVRSMKNLWSFPSGLHENGLTMAEQLAVELDEELSLKVPRNQITGLPVYCEQVGTYENIVVGNNENEDDWHWVISVCVILVANSHAYTNNEPRKCDKVIVVKSHKLCNHLVLWSDEVSGSSKSLVWTPNLGEFIDAHSAQIQALLKKAKEAAWSAIDNDLLSLEIMPAPAPNPRI
jgi:ADP-ribose pyrophosphatase YjhB (NUDIX family)